LGKVVKGARASEARYTIAVPDVERTVVHGIPEATSYEDDYGFNAYARETPGSSGSSNNSGFGSPQPAPTPQIDFDALQSEAEAIIDGAQRDAEALLTDAHARARAMIDDAGARAEMIAENARRAAHEAGHSAGTQAAEREMSEMLATMRNLIEMARAERHKIIESAEPELVKLAMGIAERVLHQQIALDRNVVVEMAKVAISRLIDRDTVTVRVNPADLERMREHREDVLAMGDVKNVRIIEDQRVDRGGVVVETDAGSVDARVHTQLAEVKKVLHVEDDVLDRSFTAAAAG
jgi:flagellar assembly protein FliH